MHRALLAFAQNLLIEPRCPICDGPWDGSLPPTAPFTTYLDELALPCQGLKCLLPLPLHSLGPFAGPVRQLLMKLHQPRQSACALVSAAIGHLTLSATAVLVPVPRWKRQRSNPLPQSIALRLGRPTAELLHRTRAGLSQHQLNKTQRRTNLKGAFQAYPLPQHLALCSAWLVARLICLGRIPAKERRR